MIRAVVVVGLVVVGWARVAEAAWYYKYSCSGTCAPGRLAVTDVSLPYPTYADCDAARSADPRLHANEQSGSLGGLTSCFESEQPPSADATEDDRPVQPFKLQTFAIGLIGGPGYKPANQPDGIFAGGLEVAFTLASNATMGFLIRTGIRGSHFAGSMPDTGLGIFWPLQIGITVSPGSFRNRIEFGADGGIEVAAAACPGCGTVASGTLRIGLVHYFNTTMDFKPRDKAARPGLGFEVVKEFRSGDIDGSMAMFRVSFRARNDSLYW